MNLLSTASAIASEARSDSARQPRHTRPIFTLWGLLFLFILRVAGQLLVVIGWGWFLPPMHQWYSGLLPYRFLLPAQILIIILYAKICWGFTRGQGLLVAPRRKIGRALLTFGASYLIGMLLRYPITMALYPERRWTGGLIPIFFHLVLSAFILSLGRHHFVNDRTADAKRSSAQRERACPETIITSSTVGASKAI
jgi:hypothetical protein